MADALHASPAELGAPPLRRVRAGARTLSFREAGAVDAPALLLLHGIGSGSASWASQLASLPARGLRVVAWDAPGYGGSEALAVAAPSPADYAAALADFADVLGLDRFSLLGHSLGALMASAFCCRAGARIDRLILAAPAAGYGKAAAEERRSKIDGRLAAMAQLGPAGLAENRAAALLSPQAPPEAVERVRAVMRQLRPDGYAQAVRMLGQADLFAEVGALTVPTLVLCGTADGVTPEAGCRRVAAAIPGARYEALPGLGHAAYVEDPRRFDAAVLRFLAASES